MYGSLFEMMTGVELVPVHYHGTGPAVPDLMSGRLQVDVRSGDVVDRLHQSRQAARRSE